MSQNLRAQKIAWTQNIAQQELKASNTWWVQCFVMIFAYGKELYQPAPPDSTKRTHCMWTAYDWTT